MSMLPDRRGGEAGHAERGKEHLVDSGFGKNREWGEQPFFAIP